MKRHLLILVLITVSIQSFSQNIDTDIFNNLTYESQDRLYKSYFKRNIFGDLIFSDNRSNEVTLKKEYIELKYGHLSDNSQEKNDVFINMIYQYRKDKNYKVTYSIDIFNKIVIEDNRNGKIEIGKDFFGNETYNENVDGESKSIERNFNGALEYKANNENAILEKDSFNKWTYKDSFGNELKFSSKTWNRFINNFGTEENIFHYLINEFLHL
ncbi:hypothetical protein [Flavobacterium aquicola]|uniref:Uncharacterized protein n=1 Tax=Flavobacterium aquicola TaxID=1682742 RepID=A0A3E0ELY5_9FLAO|nr:hypothetical protein [Flavobacterium aquicola]REG98146.1 hypothetical protein C8P67_10769 [Flavobacterium aquicola]